MPFPDISLLNIKLEEVTQFRKGCETNYDSAKYDGLVKSHINT